MAPRKPGRVLASAMNASFRPGTIWTIGHSTRAIVEFVQLLKDSTVAFVADVRSFPHSRRNPQFDIEALPVSLSELGIGYQHIAELGGRRHRARAASPSPNVFWRNESF